MLTGALLAATQAYAQEPTKAPIRVVTGADTGTERAQTRITITGSKAQTAKSLPGSAYVVDKKTLEQGNFSDPQRALRGVPGVNIVEEEGFGNRPNIGMRASRTDRSADLTIMEDGVLIAPAPYSAPSAYFFPRIERMESIEVRKGSSAIAYGPRTTNGAINFLSSSIPHDLSGMVKGSIGSYGSHREQIRVGNDSKHVGFVIDALNTQSDGFKDTDFVGGNTGFKTQDVMTKLRLKTDAEADMYQELEAKFSYTNEDSNETYLGLTNEDFNANPYRRYAASQLDKVHVDHKLYQLRHYIEPAAGLDITTTAYYRTLDRDWDKLEGVNAGSGNRGLGAVLSSPSGFANELAILRGGNSVNNALTYRDNDRAMQVRGVQTAADYKFATGSIEHQLEMGLRLHQDSEDRFQTNHFYRMDNGRMIQTSSAAAGSNSNRISGATAWSGHILNRMDFGALSVTPGVRYEHVELKTRDYGASDPDRTGSDLTIFRNEVSEYMPGTLLAVCVVALKNYPVKGGRNDFALAFVGALLRVGCWTAEEIEKAMQAVSYLADDEEWQERIKVVRSTQDKLGKGDPVTGFPALEKLIGQQNTEIIKKWCKKLNPDGLGYDDVNADQLIETLNKQYALVLLGGKGMIMKFPQEEAHAEPEFLTIAGFRDYYQNRIIQNPLKKKAHTYADYWLTHPKRRTYEGVNMPKIAEM